WLGTRRVMSGVNGTVSNTCTGLSFADGVSCTGLSWNWFTDDIHDQESNLEHTMFRQLSGIQGRWTTPDPYLGSMIIANPQSLNRYAYVLGNPINGLDPLGLDGLNGCSNKEKGGGSLRGCSDGSRSPFGMGWAPVFMDGAEIDDPNGSLLFSGDFFGLLNFEPVPRFAALLNQCPGECLALAIVYYPWDIFSFRQDYSDPKIWDVVI